MPSDAEALLSQMSWRGLLAMTLIGSPIVFVAAIGAKLLVAEMMHQARQRGIPEARAIPIMESVLRKQLSGLKDHLARNAKTG